MIMESTKCGRLRRLAGVTIPVLAAVVFAVGAAAQQPQNGGTQQGGAQQRSARPLVTIYKFRSSVPEVDAAAATDMFTTALIKTNRFAVLERQRMKQDIMREKQLNSQGLTTGNAGSTRLTGARYIFEGTVSEANPNESETDASGGVEGLGVGGHKDTAMIGIDVRIVDADTGAVLDAVNVRKHVEASGAGVSNVGGFLSRVTGANLHGANVNVHQEKRQSVDKVLRECIQEAVNKIADRFGVPQQ